MNEIGNLHEDTFVGWTGPTAWTVNIIERYHSETELDEDDVDALIELLQKAKKEMLKAKEEYQEKDAPKEKQQKYNIRWAPPGEVVHIGGKVYKTL